MSSSRTKIGLPEASPSSTIDNSSKTIPNVSLSELKDERFYLGSNKIKNAMYWLADGYSSVLVPKSENQKSSENLSTDPATMSIVVKISSDQCWLRSDAHWSPESPVKIADIKLQFFGVPPDNAEFAEEFKLALHAIQHYIDLTGSTLKKEGVIVAEDGFTKLRFRHVIFAVSTV